MTICRAYNLEHPPPWPPNYGRGPPQGSVVPYFDSQPLSMNSAYQLTLDGQREFLPPRFRLRVFLEKIFQTKPELLDPRRHKDLMFELARYVGLKPEDWGIHLSAIKWLMEISPDVERACRNYRADAL
jgi:hypothetical protein